MHQAIKTFFLTALLLLSSFCPICGQEITFKVSHKEKTIYTSDMILNMVMQMEMKGDPEVIKSLEKSGLPQPIELKQRSDTRMITRTGSKKYNRIPVSMHIEKANVVQTIRGVNKEIKSPLSDFKMEGWVDKNGQLELDTISGIGKPELSKLIKQMINNLRTTIKFPEKPLKVGDSFNQETPMNIPLLDKANVKAVVKTIYKFVKVEKQLAVFNLDQTVSLDMNYKQVNMNTSGKGKGRLIYDVNKSFVTYYGTDMEMDLAVTVEKLVMKAKSKASSKQTVLIRDDR